MLNAPLLDSYLGQSISAICPHGYDSNKENHCAHFVAHALQLDFGYTCAKARGRHGGANLRVHELFAQCSKQREVLECPSSGRGLIFVSARSNFHGKPVEISNVPRKHVGIYYFGKVWHYSNLKHKVITQTPGEFLFHYSRQHNALWLGELPAACSPAMFGTCT